MPYPLLRREVRLMARDVGPGIALIGLLAAMLASGVLLLVRVLEPRPGQPLAGESLVSSLVGLQWVLSGLVAPWALARLGDGESRDEAVVWGALCAVAPWRLAGARLVAAWVYLLQLLIVPVPLLLVVRSVVGASSGALLGAWVDLGCWLLLLAPAMLLCQLAGGDFMRRLGLSYLAAGLLAVARHAPAAAASSGVSNALTLAAAAGLVLLLLLGSRRRLLYLR